MQSNGPFGRWFDRLTTNGALPKPFALSPKPFALSPKPFALSLSKGSCLSHLCKSTIP